MFRQLFIVAEGWALAEQFRRRSKQIMYSGTPQEPSWRCEASGTNMLVSFDHLVVFLLAGNTMKRTDDLTYNTPLRSRTACTATDQKLIGLFVALILITSTTS